MRYVGKYILPVNNLFVI